MDSSNHKLSRFLSFFSALLVIAALEWVASSLKEAREILAGLIVQPDAAASHDPPFQS